MSGYRFVYDQRLGIPLPELDQDWECYDMKTREKILMEWEKVRGTIPDRISCLERQIEEKQRCLDEEEDFDTSCRLNREIAELASVINDLWIWYRLTEEVAPAVTHA